MSNAPLFLPRIHQAMAATDSAALLSLLRSSGFKLRASAKSSAFSTTSSMVAAPCSSHQSKASCRYLVSRAPAEDPFLSPFRPRTVDLHPPLYKFQTLIINIFVGPRLRRRARAEKLG